MKDKITVLFISNQGGGAPKSLLNMIKSLKEWVNPIVLFENNWYDYQLFVEEGIESIIVPFRMNMVLDKPEYKTIRWRLHRLIDEYCLNKRVARRVASILNGRNVDIVHTNTGAITIGNEVARILKAKSVWHLREFQDKDFGGNPYEGWKNFYGKLKDADAVIGITQAIGEHFHFKELRNANVIWNAVRSKADSVMNFDKENYILYCSSMIVPVKGLHDLVEAYAHSILPSGGVTLKVIGIMDKGYGERINKLLVKYNLIGKVIFEGNQDNVKPYFEKAKAFVLPSLNEGLGRVVVESMFYGCPVVVRRKGGPMEYIEDNINGYFFDTTENLTSMLNEICSEDQKSLIIRAQQFAISNFSEEVYGRKILSIYQKLLGR